MKKTFVVLTGIICCISSLSYSQSGYKEWDQKPVLHKTNTIYAKANAVILQDDRIHEIKADTKDQLWLYTYAKKLIKLNDAKGVEMYNKVFIYIPNDAVVEEVKARSIQPNGKTVNLPADKIFSVEEEGKQYKKFALEGIEIGSEIEYVVRLKKEVSLFGLEIFQPGNSSVEKASFTLITPEFLDFTVKGYNGFSVQPVSIAEGKRVTVAVQENIDVLDEDKYANVTPHSSNIQYKLSYNHNKDKNVRLNTWSGLANNVYNNYNNYNEKELKAIDEMFGQIKLPVNGSEESKIIAIEDFLKNNINTEVNAIGEDGDKLEKIVKNRVAGTFGFVRLFNGILEKGGIRHQIVFPSKRNDYQIDQEFENYRLIDEPIFYFPATGNYLEPLNVSVRYPHIDPYSAGTMGLFLKVTSIGNFKTAIASFDSIPLQPYESSSNNIYLKIKFNQTLDSLHLKSKQSMSGYTAASYRPVYAFLPKEKQEEVTKSIIRNIGNSDEIKNVKVENSAMTDGSKNLSLNILGDIATATLIEKAGNKILVKIGEVIGSQEQMYQEKKRVLPVVVQYPHALDREISFMIPPGYQIKNISDIKIEVTDKSINNPETMGFVSTYVIKGSELIINVHEFYKSTYYPVSQFEQFRNVINAASDFNKLVLILEKI